ncbi:MAG TPA: alpha/beta hydrolase [Bryobacteraceae bacterium]|jgi:pimeloyl-ACP methyl ester carboxylesterase|nr:alpha/beta hydrolase [Bryobacteraceae bacterium]
MTLQTREFFQMAIYAGLLLLRLHLLRGRWRMPLLHGREYFLGKRVEEGFYEGAGGRILAEYRRFLLLPYLLELLALVALIVTHRLLENITWLLLGGQVVGLTVQAMALRYAWKRAAPFTIAGGPPPKVALPLESRELKQYTHPALEGTLLLVTVASIAALIWHDGFTTHLYPVILVCYVQIGLLLIKSSLVAWRSPLPADQAEPYHRLRQAQRMFFMRACDWLRGFGGLFLVMLVIGTFRGEDALRWASATLGIGYLIAYAIGTMRDMRRVARLSTEVRPVKLHRATPDNSVQHAIIYRPELPAMFVRRTRGWALNFGNPRALMYAGYLMIGVILGTVSARAATPEPYSLAGVTDKGTFVRYVLGQDQGPITFDWKPDGSFENHLKTRITRDIRIIPDAQGRWKEIEVSTPNRAMRVRRDGDKVTLDGEAVATKPGAILYGPPALLALIVRAYDPSRGGRQTVSLLSLPGTPFEATIEKLEAKDSMQRYLLRTSGEDLVLYLDAQGKLLLAHNPLENTGFQREGFATLRTAAVASEKPSPSLKGRWDGSLAGQMRVIFEFAEEPNGTWKGILRSPDQGPGAVEFDEIKLDGTKLHLVVKSAGATWDGDFDGRSLKGKWSQGQEIPLDLFRPGSPPPATARKWGLPLTPCRVANDRVEGMCGSFEVFENRATRTGRKIKLAFLVAPAKAERPEPDPVFLIAGGPGQGSIEAFAQTGYVKSFGEKRDVVMLDQRGTGGSNRLGCASTQSTSRLPTAQQLIPCREELQKIADLKQYTTSIAMDDLDEVRAALGYQQINLLGGSYGTRAALEYMRRHGDRVRTVIIKGVAPPGYKLPLPFARTVQDALGHLFADCAADFKCRAAYPKLKEEFEALLDHLAKEPFTYKVEPPMAAQAMDWTITREGLLDMLRPMLYTPSIVAMMPRLIHQASSGDFKPLGALSYQIVSQLERGIARGMSLSVLCSEDVAFITDEEVARETRGTYMGGSNVASFRQACSVWPKAEVPARFLEPVKSDKPVLLISGDEDPATPAASAELAARHLPNSRHVVIRGGTHGTQSDCLDKIAADFVARGSAKDVDASCVAEIKRPPFVVP